MLLKCESILSDTDFGFSGLWRFPVRVGTAEHDPFERIYYRHCVDKRTGACFSAEKWINLQSTIVFRREITLSWASVLCPFSQTVSCQFKVQSFLRSLSCRCTIKFLEIPHNFVNQFRCLVELQKKIDLTIHFLNESLLTLRLVHFILTVKAV